MKVKNFLIILICLVCISIPLISYGMPEDLAKVKNWEDIPESRYNQQKTKKYTREEYMADWLPNLKEQPEDIDTRIDTFYIGEVDQELGKLNSLLRNVKESDIKNFSDDKLQKYINCYENLTKNPGFGVIESIGQASVYLVDVQTELENLKKKFADRLTQEQNKQINDIENKATEEINKDQDKLIEEGANDDNHEQEKEYIIYNNPEIADSDDRKTGNNIDSVIEGAEDFMDMDTGSSPMETDDLSDFSKTLSGILMTIAIVVSVVMAGILGIKFMLGGVDEKTEVKQLLIPYIIGCVVVFGAFAIWKIAVELLGNM